MRNVPAPPFNTLNLLGKHQRLEDQKGKVVLVYAWATWCGPWRWEMPKLDQLYRTRQKQGFVVFGLSEQEVRLQGKFVEQVPVSYPLLTLQQEVPSFYRDIARCPAIFLIDRRGQLHPPPDPTSLSRVSPQPSMVSSTVLASAPRSSTFLGERITLHWSRGKSPIRS